MCQGKIIRSYELRAQVVSLDEKAGLLEVEVHVCVDQWVVADLHLVLDLEHLRGGLVVRGIVGREVAHVHAQLDGQGPDIGPQYLSGIFYTSYLQKHTAEDVMALLRRRGHEVNTFLAPAAVKATKDTPVDQTFWPAEDYHQHYYGKNGGTPYCHFRTPKFE